MVVGLYHLYYIHYRTVFLSLLLVQVHSQILAAVASGNVASLTSIVQSQGAQDVVPLVENKVSAL